MPSLVKNTTGNVEDGVHMKGMAGLLRNTIGDANQLVMNGVLGKTAPPMSKSIEPIFKTKTVPMRTGGQVPYAGPKY
jgi:hypothetical protein